MSQAPHPIEIRTVLMCALLQAGHDVPTAAAMLDQAEAAVLGRPADSRQNPPEKRETTAAMESHGNSIAAPAPNVGYVPALERLAKLDTTGMTAPEIAAALGITETYAFKLCKDLGKTYKRRHRGPDKAPRAKRAPAAERTEPKRRFTEHAPLNPEAVQGLPATHEAVRQARTLFPTTVVDPQDSPRLLVSGEHNRKTGDPVPNGRRRLPAKVRRRCDCGNLFDTDVLDETMCPACTANAARHREAQAREARA